MHIIRCNYLYGEIRFNNNPFPDLAKREIETSLKQGVAMCLTLFSKLKVPLFVKTSLLLYIYFSKVWKWAKDKKLLQSC